MNGARAIHHFSSSPHLYKVVAVWIGSPDFSARLAYLINPTNGDLLPELGLPGVGSGSYGVYVKNYDFGSSPSTANYQLDFGVAGPTPEPGSGALCLLGGFVLALRRFGNLRARHLWACMRTENRGRPNERNSGGLRTQPLIVNCGWQDGCGCTKL